jgi:MFS family permease
MPLLRLGDGLVPDGYGARNPVTGGQPPDDHVFCEDNRIDGGCRCQDRGRAGRPETGAGRVFAAGLAVFAAASAACGLAPGLGFLVAARLVQGAGAALLVPSSLVLLQAAYPTREGRARAFGVWGAIAGIGAASGPIVGGLLVTEWSWRGVFFLNLPFAVAAMALTGRSVPATGPRPRGVDLPGQIPGIAGLGLLTWSLVEAGQASATSGRIMARTGPRLPMLTGLLLGGAGLLGLIVAGVGTSYSFLIIPMAATGFGMALTMPAATAAVIEAAPPDRGGIASGVVNAARQSGGVLGVALLGSMVHTRATFIPGLHVGLVIAAGAFFAAAAVTFRGTERVSR